MKKLLFPYLTLAALLSFTACSSDDSNDTKEENPVNKYGLYNDSYAGAAPTITRNTVTLPNISAPTVETGTNGMVGNFNLTGIKASDGSYLSLSGTGAAVQNIWLTIDGKAKAVSIVNADDVSRAVTKGQADIVFLMDNSGSMGEEADSIAKEILAWADSLSNVVDCKFGCVGYGDNYYGIDGGTDLDDVSVLGDFLNKRGRWGIYRTQDFYGAHADNLQAKALSYDEGYYNGAYNECGVLALHFADELFTFREGANRIYINFTDEPNQPAGYPQWSVETLNPNDTLYNWNAAKGTVHTVYSATDVQSYEAPNGSNYLSNISNPFWNAEKPWAMSEYTGGLSLFANSTFTNVTLNSLEVTTAILSSYIMRFNITDDLRSGLHTITISIKDRLGNQAVKTYKDVSFSLPTMQ